MTKVRIKLRLLAINVSIPNLEQFRPPQLRNQREWPTNIGVDWKLDMLYMKSCSYLQSQAIYS